MAKREEKLVEEIRRLQKKKSSENSRCFNCTQKGPQYVCLDFHVFVCSGCSGIHREFNHRVKGVTMSLWTEKEVEALKKGGNRRARKVWRAKWKPEEFPEPEPSEKARIREFIKLTFEQKRWYRSSKSKDKPRRERDSDAEEDDASSDDDSRHRRRGKGESRRRNRSPSPEARRPKATAAPAPASSDPNNLLAFSPVASEATGRAAPGFDVFGAGAAPAAAAPAAPATSGGWNAFGGAPAAASAPRPAFDPFASSAAAPPAHAAPSAPSASGGMGMYPTLSPTPPAYPTGAHASGPAGAQFGDPFATAMPGSTGASTAAAPAAQAPAPAAEKSKALTIDEAFAGLDLAQPAPAAVAPPAGTNGAYAGYPPGAAMPAGPGYAASAGYGAAGMYGAGAYSAAPGHMHPGGYPGASAAYPPHGQGYGYTGGQGYHEHAAGVPTYPGGMHYGGAHPGYSAPFDTSMPMAPGSAAAAPYSAMMASSAQPPRGAPVMTPATAGMARHGAGHPGTAYPTAPSVSAASNPFDTPAKPSAPAPPPTGTNPFDMF